MKNIIYVHAIVKDSKDRIIEELKDRLVMIFNSYGVLDHYQVELIEDTLKDCLNYLGDKENE